MKQKDAVVLHTSVCMRSQKPRIILWFQYKFISTIITKNTNMSYASLELKLYVNHESCLQTETQAYVICVICDHIARKLPEFLSRWR